MNKSEQAIFQQFNLSVYQIIAILIRKAQKQMF